MSWSDGRSGLSGRLQGERVERVYRIGGSEFRPPTAGGKGAANRSLGLRMLRDGITECLRWCPKSERVLMTELQRAWVEVSRLESMLPEVPENQELLNLGEPAL